ncbi:MAG: helix-turn-helix transcriptional regulator [Anaerolineae bacterium]|nr:helix-turn-helix transcriptional regulator [Anaerolineae bacterium]
MLEKLLELFPEQEETKPNKFTIYMGNAIKEAREEQGFSQEELAQKIYRRRATLSDIENGKSDVDAGTLWLLSAYLKKPLSYFYPPYARENIRPEEMGELEHELLMHFIGIRADELKRLAIRVVSRFEEFDPVDLYQELLPYIKEMEEKKAIRKAIKERSKKGK